MTGAIHRTPHALVPLFPQFLRKRRRGFPGLTPLLAEADISRPLFFALMSLAQFPAEGATARELRPGAPYATRDPHLPLLAEGMAHEVIARDDWGRYTLTERGRALLARAESAATRWLAEQRPLPEAELRRLADEFAAIADQLPRSFWGPDAHIHRWPRVTALAPAASDAPLVRLERAIMDLWMARDDAHMDAWDSARFAGPHLDVITHLWQGDVADLEGLQAALAATIDPETVEAIVDELTMQGYVEVRLGILQPTRAGYNVREEIEAETDERYFQHWPDLDSATITWLHTNLGQLIAALPDSPRE